MIVLFKKKHYKRTEGACRQPFKQHNNSKGSGWQCDSHRPILDLGLDDFADLDQTDIEQDAGFQEVYTCI